MLEEGEGEKSQKKLGNAARTRGWFVYGGGECSMFPLSFVLVARERRQTEQRTNLVIIIIVIERKEIIDKETRTSENYRREIQSRFAYATKKEKERRECYHLWYFFPSVLL